MDPDSIWQVVIFLILLALSAFFSLSETALTSLNKIRIKRLIEENVKGADMIHRLLEEPNKIIGAILVGNNLANIAAAVLVTAVAKEYFHKAGIGIAIGVTAILILIFGEAIPKSLAAQYPEQISLRIVKIISFLNLLLSPIVSLLTWITNGLLHLFGISVDKEQPYVTTDELKTMVDVIHEEGVLEVEEKEMIHNVFEFADEQVKDIMTPRTDMVSVEIGASYQEVLELFKKEQFSRMPVYQESTDNIVGILHVKDLIAFNSSEEEFDISKLMRETYFTYEYKKISDLFDEMRKNRASMAIVLDEYGGTAGIVTMEDLVEEIVGDIEDEYDEADEQIQVIRENEFIVDGSAKIDLVNEMIGVHIESEDFDSIGGFVIGEIGRFPAPKETIEYNNIKFIIESIDRNRIKKLRVVTTKA